jgi:hypothetical protein
MGYDGAVPVKVILTDAGTRNHNSPNDRIPCIGLDAGGSS